MHSISLKSLFASIFLLYDSCDRVACIAQCCQFLAFTFKEAKFFCICSGRMMNKRYSERASRMTFVS